MVAPDADGWKDAVDREMQNPASYHVCELVPPAPDMRTLCRIAFIENSRTAALRNKGPVLSRVGTNNAPVLTMVTLLRISSSATLKVDPVVVGAARKQCCSFALSEHVQTEVIRLEDKGPERVEFSRQIEIDPC